MSAEENPSQTPILRPPATTVAEAATKFGLIGVAIGLTFALAFVVVDHHQANSVAPVFAQARTIVLHYHAENGAWPQDFDLAQPGAPFAGYRLTPLAEALANCDLPGRWAFVAKGPEGVPAVVFTPVEAGRRFQRTLGVVDGWIDDGEPLTGEMRVGAASASLRLSGE
jgi:hypothetical protein